MRLCVRWLHVCPGEEKRTLRKSAFCARTLTEKRILCAAPHGKAHFACGPHQGTRSACERTHEASFLIPICMMEARANQPDGIPQMVDMSNPTHCGKLLGMTMVATGVRNTLGMTEER